MGAIDEMATATVIIVIVCVILTAVIIYATKSKWRKICAGTKVHVYQLKEVTIYGDDIDTTWMNAKSLNPHVSLFDNLGVDELQDLNLVDVEDLVEEGIHPKRAAKMVAEFRQIASQDKSAQAMEEILFSSSSANTRKPSQWISKHHLSKYSDILKKLGVEELGDLDLIGEKDLVSAGVNP